VFYIFHGEDEFGQSEELAGLRNRLAGDDPAMAELNTSTLDGTRLTLGELRHVCDSVPFMSDRRLVIVHGLLSRLAAGRKGRRQKASRDQVSSQDEDLIRELSDYLPNLPPFTRLMFVENKTLPASHPILKLAADRAVKDRAFVKLFDLPQEHDLPGWIHRRAREKGGSLSAEAARMLALLVGRDPRLLDQEIGKLLLYADGRPVEPDDIEALVSRARETSIFDLVDAVGQRQTDRALRLLHRLLEDGEPPLYLLTMLARQVRILIQVSELQDQGLTESEIAARLKLHPYVVKKGRVQARNFQMAQLEAAHRRLVETDLSIKTSAVGEVLALDTLVVALSSA
jgi:DNA polymerase-3 subunit delta